MVRNLLVLADGSEIFSGVAGQTAILETTLTQSVSGGRELVPGGVGAAMLEMTLLCPEGLPIRAGDRISLYHVTGEERTQVGIFLAQQPERAGKYRWRLTAYDPVCLLEKDLTDWVTGLTGWPYSLRAFAGMVCDACGVTLHPADLPGGDYPVEKFSAQGITGRQLMAWVAQATGRFCRARAEGTLELAWFTPSDLVIGPKGEHYYFSGGFTYSDYQVAPVEKVRLRLTEQEVGAIYPDIPEAVNTMILTGNHLLTGPGREALAQNLYEQFRGITYTPGSVTVPGACPAAPGQVVTVVDPDGGSHVFYIMERVQTGQKAVLTCTGSPRRDSSAAVNQAIYQAVSGKVLNLELEAEGMKLEARSLEQEILEVRASVAVQADQIIQSVLRSYVEQQALESVQTTVQSQIRQLADSVALRFETTARQLSDTAGSLQNQLNTITKHITFHTEGMTIGASDSPYQINIDNDQYQMTYNGKEIFFVRSGEVYTPALTVEELLSLLGYKATRDEKGNVDWDYVE